ncbi:MAG: bifunctional adenosylcobinamide kinase/adenosylcobinamide-phosphate guanylyltransferase [Caloramator sp.]|nr:bifunctional adenosylcobinamide kinase/adenosylcobinamide-phosphate guanylyltransferase [Caloramator sp.]
MIRLISGGVRSGKSTFAEKLLEREEDVVYIATMRPIDSEVEERISLHRQRRKPSWRTFEGTYNLKDAVGKEKNYLLDCLTNLISNIMFDKTKDLKSIDYKMQQEIENKVMEEISGLIRRVREIDGSLIIVTNEVGMSVVPENHIARVFRDIQGRVNQMAAALSDEVYIVFLGIPLKIK